MDQILGKFKNYSDNPLQDIGYETVKGRSFRIQGTNQVDTIITNMQLAAQRFDRVAAQTQRLAGSIPAAQRTWYNDNLLAQATIYATHHGDFAHWYTHDRLFGMDGKIKGMKRIIEDTK